MDSGPERSSGDKCNMGGLSYMNHHITETS